MMPYYLSEVYHLNDDPLILLGDILFHRSPYWIRLDDLCEELLLDKSDVNDLLAEVVASLPVGDELEVSVDGDGVPKYRLNF